MLPSASFPENMNDSRMVSSASPARIELATNALGIQRGTETEADPDRVEGGDVAPLRSVSDSALTHDAGQIACDGVIAGPTGGPDDDHPGEPIGTDAGAPVVPLRSPSEPALTHDLGQVITPPRDGGYEPLNAAFLQELLELATRGKRWHLVAALGEQLEAIAEAEQSNVTRLDDRRGR